jgi:hypothetical protein
MLLGRLRFWLSCPDNTGCILGVLISNMDHVTVPESSASAAYLIPSWARVAVSGDVIFLVNLSSRKSWRAFGSMVNLVEIYKPMSSKVLHPFSNRPT